MFERYIEDHAKKEKRTWAVMEKDFVRNLGVWKDRKLSNITAVDVNRLHKQLRETRGLYTANRQAH
jgi:hypothetical protein